MVKAERKRSDTRRGTSRGGGATRRRQALPRRVVSGDRNAGESANKQRRSPGETPRDKPVEEEADKDVKHGGG